jgi:DNA phosphorothioation-dependent restriction protein DptG
MTTQGVKENKTNFKLCHSVVIDTESRQNSSKHNHLHFRPFMSSPSAQLLFFKTYSSAHVLISDFDHNILNNFITFYRFLPVPQYVLKNKNCEAEDDLRGRNM